MDLLNEININMKDLIIYRKNELVVIYNKNLGKHFIMTEEVYNFFEGINGKGITFHEFINNFEDQEDKKYIKQIIDYLMKLGVFDSNKESYNIQNAISIGQSIYICTTKRCNLKCKHCSLSCSGSEIDFLNTDQLKEMINIISCLKPTNIVLTGGEPLIRDDFTEIVNYIRQKLGNIYLILSTNGTLIDDTNIDVIVGKIDKVDISIDGVDEETCSITRGKGVFQKAIGAVKKLQEKGFYNIGLSMVFGDKNMHLSEKFKELNKTLKTKAVERYFVPKGRGKENVLQYYSMDTALPMYIPENLYRHADLENKKISSCACNAFKSQISINYDGNIYPCPSLIKEEYNIGSVFDEEVVTNLKNKNLEKIEAYKRFQEIYPYNFYKCSKCDVNIFCWHCPAILDSVKEDDKEFNRWCNLMKPILNKIVWDEEVI